MEDVAAAGESLAAACLVPHPATRLVMSPFPVFDIWHAHRGDSKPDRLKLVGEGQGALITRPALQVRVTPLPQEAALLTRALLNGLTIEEAVGEGDETVELQSIFQTLFIAGAFVALDFPRPSRSEKKG